MFYSALFTTPNSSCSIKNLYSLLTQSSCNFHIIFTINGDNFSQNINPIIFVILAPFYCKIQAYCANTSPFSSILLLFLTTILGSFRKITACMTHLWYLNYFHLFFTDYNITLHVTFPTGSRVKILYKYSSKPSVQLSIS